MEDAHICQPFLYAEKLNDGASSTSAEGDKVVGGRDGSSNNSEGSSPTPNKKAAIETTLSSNQDLVGMDNKTIVSVTENKTTPRKKKEEVATATTTTTTTTTTSIDDKYVQIPLPNHALFAVFDGHGGSFAAEYASRNLLRVLTRSSSFIEYAEKWRGRDTYLLGLKERLSLEDDKKTTTTTTTAKADTKGAKEEGEVATPEKEVIMDDKQRLQMLKKRGLESDEKVKQIKEQVRKHFDGERLDVTNLNNENNDSAAASTSSVINNNEEEENNTEYQYAQATYDHELMTLLENSLRNAFMDIDAEILREVRGEKVDGANVPYGVGYDLSRHSLEKCVGHLPREAASTGGASDINSSVTAGSSSDAQQTNNNTRVDEDHHDHPTPSDDEDAGTTAVVVMTTPKWIVCANAGDSRAVYSRSNHRAVPLSYDHKPDDEDEERRIREAGGYVSGGRVEGDLAVSRGLGDYRFKDLDAVMSGSRGEGVRRTTSMMQRQPAASSGGQQQQQSSSENEDVPMLRPSEQKVSPVPDIIVQNRDPKEDEFIIIACDGIWDVQTNQECVRMVADMFSEGESDLGLVAEEVKALFFSYHVQFLSVWRHYYFLFHISYQYIFL